MSSEESSASECFRKAREAIPQNKKHRKSKSIFSYICCGLVNNPEKLQSSKVKPQINSEEDAIRDNLKEAIMMRNTKIRETPGSLTDKLDSSGRILLPKSHLQEEEKTYESRLKLLGRQMGDNKGKKTIVLNLDETLIHSVFTNEDDSDYQFNLVSAGKAYNISTYKRPYLEEFLDHISKKFEVVFYTPAISEYANAIINKIDSNNIVAGRLFRDSCKIEDNPETCGFGKNFIKDISKLGRLLNNVIVLDSNTMTCIECIQNTVPIRPWFRDKKDKELKEIIPILDSLAKVKDVRVVIQNIIDKMPNIDKEKKGKYNTPFQNPKNIKYKDRDNYYNIMGNYITSLQEYNPKKAAMIKKYEPLKKKPKKIGKLGRLAGDLIIFNHNQGIHQVDDTIAGEGKNKVSTDFKDSNISASQSTTTNMKSLVRTFLKASTDQPNEEVSKIENSYHCQETHKSESEPSFAEHLFKKLKNPTSESEGESESSSKNNNFGVPEKNRMSEQLKTFFCFDQ
ncbi:unnamed protein product [Moneuplotes crassus]|uniref:FCP1 homology domain-containing protein n=1 Tax=Euplotes crassus TaxID=5936 RepID=A0AAD1UB79_EUPCR|nr:unnamed protein product [Moneuplotes crassus]